MQRAVAAIGITGLVLGSLLGTGCSSKDNLTVWRTEALSPDGLWVATADTVQNGGFGSANIDTSVYLRGVKDKTPAVQVLGFSCEGPVPHPYVLDNAANRGGTIGLELLWLDPTHLRVTHNAHPDLYFQAVKFHNVTIGVVDLSKQ
jgi:hypothetical protein